MSVKGMARTEASQGIFRAIAQISVTTREMIAERTKGAKFSPVSFFMAPVSKGWYSAWKRRSARTVHLQ